MSPVECSDGRKRSKSHDRGFCNHCTCAGTNQAIYYDHHRPQFTPLAQGIGVMSKPGNGVSPTSIPWRQNPSLTLNLRLDSGLVLPRLADFERVPLRISGFLKHQNRAASASRSPAVHYFTRSWSWVQSREYGAVRWRWALHRDAVPQPFSRRICHNIVTSWFIKWTFVPLFAIS